MTEDRKPSPPPGWAVTNRREGGFREHPDLAEAAIAAGAAGIILEENNFEIEELMAEALKVRQICDRHGLPFRLRGHSTAAFVIGADIEGED